ncbi:uracil phosphoribosyltransferase [Haploplasma modicum]|uniref:uracil phosphoribosyltransferase n=1 Tax=Haploplasma modicum TaxID=2150 RepID=UPI00214AE58B|nr:uracil phosphoribosyltransferase [Haploplasma modicum]MCR1809308.1 uracil phosphoribosyltransferase [Haploplasma modicum]
MSNVHVLEHPLIKHKLTVIRDKNTKTKEFRESVNEIAGLLTFEITRNLTLKEKIVETPVDTYKGSELAEEIVIVPILRAGLGMVEGIHNLIPTAKIGHIGLYRDEETLEAKEYYSKFPDTLKDSTILLVDPMLATGNSTVKAIEILKSKGAKHIIFVGIVGSPEGVKRLREYDPNVMIYLAALDEKLNKNGYIVPGLGDAGDRLFGTK